MMKNKNFTVTKNLLEGVIRTVLDKVMLSRLAPVTLPWIL